MFWLVKLAKEQFLKVEEEEGNLAIEEYMN
jgi:hypothetical protein